MKISTRVGYFERHFHRFFLRLIFVMSRDLETLLLIVLLKELDHLILFLSGWSQFRQISKMFTLRICFLLNKFHSWGFHYIYIYIYIYDTKKRFITVIFMFIVIDTVLNYLFRYDL